MFFTYDFPTVRIAVMKLGGTLMGHHLGTALLV